MSSCLTASTARALLCMLTGEQVVGVSLVVPWVSAPPLAVLLGLEGGLHLRETGRPISLLFCFALLCQRVSSLVARHVAVGGNPLQGVCLFCLLVGCLSSQQQASVSQGRICTDNFTCCHTETEAADQTFCLTQSQYTDTGPTSPSADPMTPGAWQGSQWSANF